jgi:hypothetical protein
MRRTELEHGDTIRIVRLEIDPENEENVNRWYNEEHEPLLRKVPGVIATFKGKLLHENGQKYCFLYVHENLDVQKSDLYRETSLTKWAKEVRPFLKNFDWRNYKAIVPSRLPLNLKKGNIIRTVEFNVARENEQEFNDWFTRGHIPALAKVPGMMNIWFAVNLGDTAQKYLAVYFQENLSVQQRQDYKEAFQTNRLKKPSSFLIDDIVTNYEVYVDV